MQASWANKYSTRDPQRMCCSRINPWSLPQIQRPKSSRWASVLIATDLDQSKMSLSIKWDLILSKSASWIISFSLPAIKLTHWRDSRSWSRRLSRAMKAACLSTFKWIYSKLRKPATWAVAFRSFNSKTVRRLWKTQLFRVIFITEAWARCLSIVGTLRVIILDAPTLLTQSIWFRSTSRTSRELGSRAARLCRRQYNFWQQLGRQAWAASKSTNRKITRRLEISKLLFQVAVIIARKARYSPFLSKWSLEMASERRPNSLFRHLWRHLVSARSKYCRIIMRPRRWVALAAVLKMTLATSRLTQ